MKKCPKCGSNIKFSNLIGLLLVLRDSIKCKKCNSRIIVSNTTFINLFGILMFFITIFLLHKLGFGLLSIVIALIIEIPFFNISSKLEVEIKEEAKSLLIIPQSKELLFWYKFGWVVCLAIGTFFLYVYLDENLISNMVMALLFFLFAILSPFLFKQLVYSIEADEEGIKKVCYRSDKEVKIKWEDIVSVEKSPMKIPITLRLIRSNKGKEIDIGTPQRGYGELIDLIKKRAKNIKKVEE